jgi:hypothetical protein
MHILVSVSEELELRTIVLCSASAFGHASACSFVMTLDHGSVEYISDRLVLLNSFIVSVSHSMHLNHLISLILGKALSCLIPFAAFL